MHHLPGGAGQRLARPGLVPGLPGRVHRHHEVPLGGGLQADVVRHPPGQHREVGRDPPQPSCQGVRVTIGQHAADFVELADHSLPLEPAAASGVPGPEHVDGGLQGLHLVQADRPGVVEVVGGQGRRAGAAHRRARVLGRVAAAPLVAGHPVVQGAGDGGARREGGARPDQSASVEHEVHSRELGEGLRGLLRLQRRIVRRGVTTASCVRTRLPMPLEPEVLSGDDTAELLGEQGGQHPRHRIARGLPPVDPAADPRGVGRQLLLSGRRAPPVDQSRQLALRPAREGEQIGELGVWSSAHVKPPGSSAPPRLAIWHVPSEHSPGFARVRQLMRHEQSGVR